jgi:lipopolysaccharide export system protein LptC
MIDRRTIAIATVLALLAIASRIGVWLLRDRGDEGAFAGPPRSDYTLEDFRMNALKADGTLSFRMSGPRLSRRNEDGSIFVDAPQYVIIDGAGRPWQGTSESAWVDRDGSTMKLEGKVVLHRQATADAGPATIESADVTTWPKEKKMESAAPSRITEPGSILSGVGMRADLQSRTLDLLADVHARLQPDRSESPRAVP